MATVTSLPHSTNGAKPTNGTRTPRRVASLLGPTIDHLLELRDLIRRAQDEERRMTADVIRAMAAAGVATLEGHAAVAVLGERRDLKPDPARFLEAVGARGYAALTVSVVAARKLLGADDLAAISATTTSPVLRVEALTPPAAA